MPRQGMAVQREQTEQYIDQNPSMVVLTRHELVDDGAGGRTKSKSTLYPQKMRAITNRSAVSAERRTVGGVVVSPEMTLMAMHDADIQRGDTFTYLGVLMEVVWVTDLGYEKLAEVASQ